MSAWRDMTDPFPTVADELREKLEAKDQRISTLEADLLSARNLYAAQEERYERGQKREDAARERIKALEAQVAELTADRERLDWLEAHAASAEPRAAWSVLRNNWVWQNIGLTYDTLRAALDAAALRRVEEKQPK